MERIGDSVEQQLARGGGGHGLAIGAITSAWAKAVGESVRRNAWPLRVGRDGTLHIATSSSSWALELDRLAPEIAERLTAQLGGDAPKKLRFAVGPVPEPAAPEASGTLSTTAAEVTPEIAAEAIAAAASIDDPELRELALRAARASLAKPPSDRRF